MVDGSAQRDNDRERKRRGLTRTESMKRPSLQFYPADWRNNSNLRRCSFAARGAWIEVMCVLHDSDEYGLVRWSLIELGMVSGSPVELLQELADKNVLKGSDHGIPDFTHTTTHARQAGDTHVLIKATTVPCWFSSRMVVDEWLRKVKGGAGRFSNEYQPDGRNQKKENPVDYYRLKPEVIKKTPGTCYHCKGPLGLDWNVDHLIPRSKGGTNNIENLVPSCFKCNHDKSNIYPWNKERHGERLGERLGDGATSPSSSSSSIDINKAFPEVPPMSRKDFNQLVNLRGVLPECAEYFWNQCEGAGWLDRNRNPIRKVEPLLMNAWRTWQQNSKNKKGDDGEVRGFTERMMAGEVTPEEYKEHQRLERERWERDFGRKYPVP